MNNILNKAIITKVDNVTRVDFIKAKEHAKYNPDELEILKAELEKWQNENNRLKKQLRIIKTLSKHKITNIEDIYKIEIEKDAKLLSDNLAEIIFLNFLPDETLLKSSWDYQKLIDDFNNELEYTQKAIRTFENIIKNVEQNNKLLPTPRILTTLSQGKEQKIKLGTYYKRSKLAIENLTLALRKFAPDIYNEKLTNCTQQELDDFILENSQEIITYVNGAYLNILEDRGFTALRYFAVKAFNEKLVESPDSEITVTPSDIYKLAGIRYTESSKGYDTKQRRAIKNAITNPEGNLRKPIHIEVPQNHKDGNAISSSNFITEINWRDEKKQVIFKIPSLFFANFENKPDYYPDDVIGRNRLMNSRDQGFKEEKLYRLHQYIASTLIDKLSFNVTTLLERSKLITYVNKGNITLALLKLQEYLDLMYEQKTLLKNKPVKTSSKTDKYGKYELERL